MWLDSRSRANFEAGSIGVHLAKTKSNLASLNDRCCQPSHNYAFRDSFVKASQRNFAWGLSATMETQAQTYENEMRKELLLEQQQQQQQQQQATGSWHNLGTTTDKDQTLSAMIASIADSLHEELRGFLASFSSRLAAREAAMAQFCDRASRPGDSDLESLSQRVEQRLAELARRSSDEIEVGLHAVRDSISSLSKKLIVQESRVDSLIAGEDWSYQLREANRTFDQKLKTRCDALEQKIQDFKISEESRQRTFSDAIAQRLDALERRVAKRFKDSENLAAQITKTIPDIEHMRDLVDSLQAEKVLSDMWQRRLSACESSSQRTAALEAQLIASERQRERSLDEQAQLVRESLQQTAALGGRMTALERHVKGFEHHGKALEQRVLATCEQQQRRFHIETRYLQGSNNSQKDILWCHTDSINKQQMREHRPEWDLGRVPTNANPYGERLHFSPRQDSPHHGPGSSISTHSQHQKPMISTPSHYFAADTAAGAPDHTRTSPRGVRVWQRVVSQGPSDERTGTPLRTFPTVACNSTLHQETKGRMDTASERVHTSPENKSMWLDHSVSDERAGERIAYASAISTDVGKVAQVASTAMDVKHSTVVSTSHLLGPSNSVPQSIDRPSVVGGSPAKSANADAIAHNNSVNASGIDDFAPFEFDMEVEASHVFSEYDGTVENDSASRKNSRKYTKEDKACFGENIGNIALPTNSGQVVRGEAALAESCPPQVESHSGSVAAEIVLKSLKSKQLVPSTHASLEVQDGGSQKSDKSESSVKASRGKFENCDKMEDAKRPNTFRVQEMPVDATLEQAPNAHQFYSRPLDKPSYKVADLGLSDATESNASLSLRQSSDHLQVEARQQQSEAAKDVDVAGEEHIEALMQEPLQMDSQNFQIGSIAKSVATVQGSMQDIGSESGNSQRESRQSTARVVDEENFICSNAFMDKKVGGGSQWAESDLGMQGDFAENSLESAISADQQLSCRSQEYGDIASEARAHTCLDGAALAFVNSETSACTSDKFAEISTLDDHAVKVFGDHDVQDHQEDVDAILPTSTRKEPMVPSDSCGSRDTEDRGHENVDTLLRMSLDRDTSERKHNGFEGGDEDEDIEALFQKSIPATTVDHSAEEGKHGLRVSGEDDEGDAVEVMFQKSSPHKLNAALDGNVSEGKPVSCPSGIEDEDEDDDIEAMFQKSIPIESRTSIDRSASEGQLSKIGNSVSEASRGSRFSAEGSEDDDNDVEAMFQKSMPDESRTQQKASLASTRPWNSAAFLLSQSQSAQSTTKQFVGKSESLPSDDDDDEEDDVEAILQNTNLHSRSRQSRPVQLDRKSLSQSDLVDDDDEDEVDDLDSLPGLH